MYMVDISTFVSNGNFIFIIYIKTYNIYVYTYERCKSIYMCNIFIYVYIIYNILYMYIINFYICLYMKGI